jgi:hypothetical protein
MVYRRADSLAPSSLGRTGLCASLVPAGAMGEGPVSARTAGFFPLPMTYSPSLYRRKG